MSSQFAQIIKASYLDKFWAFMSSNLSVYGKKVDAFIAQSCHYGWHSRSMGL
ncbi:MAG: hypothetical protein U5M51_10940 [Emticicia sp.]|nr:hypothetical protein [Emticicia sp.]